MNDYEFGNYLTELRRKAGLSQFQLGKLMGVSDKAVSKWENGSARPRMQTCRKLAEYYRITMDEFLACGGTEDKESEVEKKFWATCAKKLTERYGECPPPAFTERLEAEKHAFAGTGAPELLCLLAGIAREAQHVEEIETPLKMSLAAWLTDITAINPLPPHTYCPRCKRTVMHPEVRDGWDLDDLVCETCGRTLIRDGHDIPFAGALADVIPGRKCGIPVDLALPSDAFENIRRNIAGAPFIKGRYRLLPLNIKYASLPEEVYKQEEAVYYAFEQRRDENGELLPFLRGYESRIADYVLVKHEAVEGFRKKYMNRVIPVREYLDTLRHTHITVQLTDSVFPCTGKPMDPRIMCMAMRVSVFRDMYLDRMDSVSRYADMETGEAVIDEEETRREKELTEAAAGSPYGLSQIVQLHGISGSLWEESARALIGSGAMRFMDYPVTREHACAMIAEKMRECAFKGPDLADRAMRELSGSENHISANTRKALEKLGFEPWFLELLSGPLASVLDSKLMRIEETVSLTGFPLFRPYKDKDHPRLG